MPGKYNNNVVKHQNGVSRLLIDVTVATVVTVAISMIAAVFLGSDDEAPLVTTSVGRIRGLRAHGEGYSMFLGIPYAVVDKSKPFGASIPNPVFKDVFNAIDDTAKCPQIEEFNRTIVGSLDCLHVNVYVPDSATPEKKLPVMVLIHGGAHRLGFSGRFLYGPKYLIRHDVVLVTLNYRLGPYGFICLDTPEVPGNEALKDQLKALRWIKNNIDAFNGDADKITILGHSTGAISVDYQLLFADDGLFHRAIVQSSTTVSPWRLKEPDLKAPIKLAAQFNMKTDNLDEALSFLAGRDTNEVISAVNKSGLSFFPCIEKPFPGVAAFIPENPGNLNVPRVKTVPLMIGVTDDEFLMDHSNKPPEHFEGFDVFSSLLNRTFDFGKDHDRMVQTVIKFYAGDEPLSMDVKRVAITDFDSDITIIFPVYGSVMKYLDNDAMAVFYYLFSYVGKRNFLKHKNKILEGGAAHADELGYLFDISYMPTPSPEDQLIVDRMTALWTNFAKYGNPTPETTALLPVKWLPVTKDWLNYLEITSNMRAGLRPFHQRITFWERFFKTNKKYVRVIKGH